MAVSLLRSDDICASRQVIQPCVCVLRMCLCAAVVSYYCANVSLQRHQRLASVIDTNPKQTHTQTHTHTVSFRDAASAPMASAKNLTFQDIDLSSKISHNMFFFF